MSEQAEWTEERLIAKAEAIAAHWRKDIGECNVFDLSRQILKLLRQQKDAHEAELATLRAESDARKQLADIHGRRMLELEAQNERLIEDKEFWRKVAVTNERATIQQQQQTIERLRGEMALMESDNQRLVAELATLRAQLEQAQRGRWEPVQPGTIMCSCEEAQCTELLVVEDDEGMLSFENDAGHWSIALPDNPNIRLCQWHEGEQYSVPSEVREAIEKALKGERARLDNGIKYYPHSSTELRGDLTRIDAALAWLSSQPAAHSQPQADDNVCRCSCAPCSYCDCKLEA